ncbi:Peptidase S8, subtilisin-related protein [Cordyceps fumosorosea ARSEF 2679]|uniref:Peptidase S8, subtilisin-related protein n=1 Tax=Cordyceps fumosorosea (strain ARSEF 2679) TaxID=1081104 RepID=A0A167ZGI8_CORFA|nr:Peptidase S8, subtilisin-related protein [Cordyceps fumosorosea ARSEF 2679]OAA67489.1 Peptidase S8, subtilisin-related protein [Cordyceps fumosorosea ARSEF 2679]
MVGIAALSLLGSLSLATASLLPFRAGPRTIPGAYIIEYEDGHNVTTVAATMGANLNHVRVHIDSESFRGVSVQLNVAANLTADAGLDAVAHSLSGTGAAKNIWPVYAYDRPDLNVTEIAPSSRGGVLDDPDTFAPHVMMQVDRLRAQGFDGAGVKLAAIDSGVDYKHPALGGCFGPGCKVSFGYDLVGDAFNGGNQPHPDPDPMDCGSHGTHVSGILAAGPNSAGFTGVAPGLTLGMYRVFGCSGGTGTDILMAAAARAARDGAQIISCSVGGAHGWSDDAFSVLLGRLADQRGIVSAVAASNDGDRGAFFPSGSAAAGSVNAIASADLSGAPSAFSSWGPTMEMALKPQFAGPGRGILSTLPGGKYGRASGTSMSTPMVAGVMALLTQALGRVSPARMRQLLSGNAKPLPFSNGSGIDSGTLAPVPQQGGGLVQAADALASRALVLSPASLSFNDTEHANANMRVTVTNAGNDTVSYQLFVRPAVSVYVLPAGGSPYPSRFPNDRVAGGTSGVLSASVTEFTLAAGQTQVLHVSAAPPAAGIDTSRLALWSGFLSVRGSDASLASIPYQGLAGSLRGATTLPANGTSVSRGNDQSHKPVPANSEFVLPKPGTARSSDDVPLVIADLALGTTTITGAVVDAASGSVVGDFPGVPYYMITRGAGFGFFWDGELANGSYAAAGTYKLRVKALRIFGDAANGRDWDTSDTVPIHISYKQ